MICPGCRCVFCPDPPAEPGDPPAGVCSKTCRGRVRQLRRLARQRGEDLPPLPEVPGADLAAAQAAARALVAEAKRAAGLCARQGKTAYPDEAAARAGMHRINAFAGLGLDDAYRCDGCDAWHLTSHGHTAVRVTARGEGELGVLGAPDTVARVLGQAS